MVFSLSFHPSIQSLMKKESQTAAVRMNEEKKQDCAFRVTERRKENQVKEIGQNR